METEQILLEIIGKIEDVIDTFESDDNYDHHYGLYVALKIVKSYSETCKKREVEIDKLFSKVREIFPNGNKEVKQLIEENKKLSK